MTISDLLEKPEHRKQPIPLRVTQAAARWNKRTRALKNIYGIYRPKYPKAVATKTTALKKIYINAGHSDTDPGAVSKYGKERTFNVKVRNACVKYLKANYKCTVHYNKGTLKDPKKIADDANKKKCDLFVSIHFNAGKGNGWEGLLTLLQPSIKPLERYLKSTLRRSDRTAEDLKNAPISKLPRYRTCLQSSTSAPLLITGRI